MATKKQMLARTRNWLKFRVMGMHVPQGPFTARERAKVKEISDKISELQDMFNKGSEELGLKVSVRCWCGRVAHKNCTDSLNKPACKEHEYLV